MKTRRTTPSVVRRVFVRSAGPVLSESFLQELVTETLSVVSVSPAISVSFSFVGDARIRRLNREFRSKDSVTDVLSFAQQEGSVVFPQPEGSLRDLGDVFLSVPQAIRQSRSKGQSLRLELSWLVTHGILHLLGYDHQTSSERAEMQGFERRVLEQFFPKQAASAILESL